MAYEARWRWCVGRRLGYVYTSTLVSRREVPYRDECKQLYQLYLPFPPSLTHTVPCCADPFLFLLSVMVIAFVWLAYGDE